MEWPQSFRTEGEPLPRLEGLAPGTQAPIATHSSAPFSNFGGLEVSTIYSPQLCHNSVEGTRVQHEVCRRLLPQVRSQLDAGSTINFGPLQIGKEGIQSKKLMAWQDMKDIALAPPKIQIVGTNGSSFAVDVVVVPNLMVAWIVMVELATTHG